MLLAQPSASRHSQPLHAMVCTVTHGSPCSPSILLPIPSHRSTACSSCLLSTILSTKAGGMPWAQVLLTWLLMRRQSPVMATVHVTHLFLMLTSELDHWATLRARWVRLCGRVRDCWLLASHATERSAASRTSPCCIGNCQQHVSEAALPGSHAAREPRCAQCSYTPSRSIGARPFLLL